MDTRELSTPDGAEIRYRVRPGRAPWVLLHGLGCDAGMWDGVVARMDPGAGLVIPELRGHGGSTLGWVAPSVDQWAADVRAVIERERIERPAVAGLSMGGYTALGLAAAAPGAVRAFALVDTTAAPDDEAARGRRADGIAVVQRRGQRAYLEGLLPLLLGPARADFEQNRARLEEMFARAGDAGIAAALVALANRPDRRPLLPAIRVPVRIVVGELDRITPPDRAREMAAAVPDGRLTILAGVAHLSAMEAPEEVAAALAGI